MYEIINISGYLSVAGLYPGESKRVKTLDSSLKQLYKNKLVFINEIVKKDNKSNKSQKENIKIIKKDEE